MRKKSNAKSYQDANGERRIRLIKDALVLLAEKNMVFKNITQLADHVAHLVSLEETIELGKAVTMAPQTLLRFKTEESEAPRKKPEKIPTKYRLLLEAYMAGNLDRVESADIVSETQLEYLLKKHPVLKPLLMKKDIQISNLKKELKDRGEELERLKAHVSTAPQIVSDQGQVDEAKYRAVQNDLDKMVTVFQRLLHNHCEWLVIDDENETVLDPAGGNQPIASKDMLIPYFRMRKNMKLRRVQ